jgi:hypothetical protein
MEITRDLHQTSAPLGVLSFVTLFYGKDEAKFPEKTEWRHSKEMSVSPAGACSSAAKTSAATTEIAAR